MTVSVRVTDAWLRMIYYCQTELPHGELAVKIVGGEPTVVVSAKPLIRFDKGEKLKIAVLDGREKFVAVDATG